MNHYVYAILKAEKKKTCAYLIYFLKLNESLIGDHESLPVCVACTDDTDTAIGYSPSSGNNK